MAWILLNIHRVTEAMGRLAVFYFASHGQASSLSAAGMLCPENFCLHSLILWEKQMSTMIEKKKKRGPEIAD